MERTSLIFIFNAESGLANAALDTLHKWFSPDTYECRLCSLGYHGFGMKQKMRDYLDSLDMELKFLHRDDYHNFFDQEVNLPAIFIQKGGESHLILNAVRINQCDSLEHLLEALSGALAKQGYSQNL